VEEAWLALDLFFMHSDEERLPLACPSDAMACPPPLDGVEAAPYDKALPPALRSPPPVSATIPSSGAVYRRLSSSACNPLPAIAGGIRFLANVP